ncbi:RNA polymerase sigma factor [Rhizobium sp. TRM95111]|nr:RNA polymerase sigma factor [Rhizobium alarense]MCF3640897.1 RNA polymerase sigma factor [Rhizobium alarense]
MDDGIPERAAAGDREAFAALLSQHYDFIHTVAWRWCGERQDAEDVAQEVCIRLAGAIRGFRGTSRFRTWLYTVTLNAARDHMRKRRREQWRDADYVREQAVSAGGGDGSDDASDDLWRAVRQLPDKQRDAVLLIYGEGLTHAAAADVLGCAETTVSWHVHEARKRLKVLLRDAAA